MSPAGGGTSSSVCTSSLRPPGGGGRQLIHHLTQHFEKWRHCQPMAEQSCSQASCQRQRQHIFFTHLWQKRTRKGVEWEGDSFKNEGVSAIKSLNSWFPSCYLWYFLHLVCSSHFKKTQWSSCGRHVGLDWSWQQIFPASRVCLEICCQATST